MSDSNFWIPLGTDGSHIEIVEYRPEWAVIFERERAAILERYRPCQGPTKLDKIENLHARVRSGPVVGRGPSFVERERHIW